ncbi:hypothetical protein [Streptomyces sp. CBMA29]|uniref:hypothetical protein n=1 Tax=Streptomyces sp. CBMA29 TaxID=1896314 RepID=UPI00166200DB|nr:hypothetical protein [Streptomyces sp. CBMA29]
MRGLLDDEKLTGAHEVQISYRPERIAVPLTPQTEDYFISVVRDQSQIWGGAVVPLIPVISDGTVEESYARILPGSAIDALQGMHPFNLFHLPEATVEKSSKRSKYGPQLAFTLLGFDKADQYRPVQVVELSPGDPWRIIYASCLGLLPEKPDAELLHESRLTPDLKFEDAIRVDRVKARGSFDDLLGRLNSRDFVTPRQLSMQGLAYGNSGSTGIRSGTITLPEPEFSRFDAGPNIVVICSPQNIRDAALLWNLRGANGDSGPLPIGILADDATPERLQALVREPKISRNGISVKSIYVTSASLSTDELSALVGNSGKNIGIAGYAEILHLGQPGSLTRNEVLVWDSGRTQFVALQTDAHSGLFTKRPIMPLMSMQTDVTVLDSPFPQGADVRVNSFSNVYRAGNCSISCSPNRRSEVRDLEWPSRLVMAKAIAAGRGFEIEESEPGRAARVLLAGISDIGMLGNLAHAPLLSMLEEMAARQGFGWYKDRMRKISQSSDPLESVGPTTDELPEKTFNEFKKALGNSDKATKYWLLWAEKSNLILKGFQLTCAACEAKQWIPIAGFIPPIVCRGCAHEMSTPFGDRSNVEFRYRISERLRRVYEQDAMGHLLVARYFHHLFSHGKTSRLIGLHPGMEIRRKGRSSLEGEADVLLFTRKSEFIPVEVKRTSSGFIDKEVGKIDHLASFLGSPWSVAVACQYGSEAGDIIPGLIKKSPSGYSRISLTYDNLLVDYPVWTLGSDPFAWDPMSRDDIEKREREFVTRLASQETGPTDWFADELMNRPKRVN